ncbi:hypothetical protein BLOT_003202 [Blomia tropicalis]|nr:hypothetical protein BLOT_003202 [Blomia tropicalis]
MNFSSGLQDALIIETEIKDKLNLSYHKSLSEMHNVLYSKHSFFYKTSVSLAPSINEQVD